MSKSIPQNPRVLVTRTDRIGDLVVSTPVFEAIKKTYPQSYLAVCVFSEHRELIEGNPFVDEVILYEKKGAQKDWLGQWFFANQIRAKKFDVVLHLHATNRMHIMGWLAGIPCRLGYDRRAPWALTKVHPYDKKEGRRHESEYLFNFYTTLFPQPAEIESNTQLSFPRVSVTDKNKLSVSNLLEHYGIHSGVSFGVIHPSASDVSKMWPANKIAEFIRDVPARKNSELSSLRWIFVGDAKAARETKMISELSNCSVVNLCEQLSLGMLAALFERSRLVVSNDSGPAHIAAAVGVPTISIFGRWQPGLNAERWRPVGKRAAIVKPILDAVPERDRKFSYIEDITVDQVIQACEYILKQ